MNFVKEQVLVKIDLRDDIPLMDAMNLAFAALPEDYRDKAFVRDDAVCYTRPETDDEFNRRLAIEKAEMQRAEAIRAEQERSWLGKQLEAPLHDALNSLNKDFATLKSGMLIDTGASVPMYDGRTARVKITISVLEGKFDA